MRSLRKANDSVVAWGDKYYGGDASKVQAQLAEDTLYIYATETAFGPEGKWQRGHMG